MSTDLYGVRVLDVAPDRREVTFTVFVVYYDTESKTFPPLPDEPGFFLHLLWERARWDGPLGELITVDQIGDEDWVNTHTRWFINHVERTSCDNYPPTDDHFARLHDFHYERSWGWQDEDLLVQAEYTVRVTDPRWTQQLNPGDSWGTTAYPVAADHLRREEAPNIPDLRHRTATFTPFEDLPKEEGTPGDLAFSDDGRYLAVTSDRDGLVIYETDGWTEHDRANSGLGLSPSLKWVPGKHVVALNERYEGSTRWAYDVAAGAPVDIPSEPGRTRSRTGRYRVNYGEDYWVEFVNSPPECGANEPDGMKTPEFDAECVAFTADESRMFVGGMGPEIHVVGLPTGSIVDTITDSWKRTWGLAVSPDGAYLAVTVQTDRYREPWECELRVLRVADHEIVTRHRGGPYGGPLAWSPDGRWLAANVTTGGDGYGGETRIFPVGLPTGPPAALLPDANG
ncbi:WD40 repeat domain-containing protein [Streptomyces sp. NPDC048483]|uniref:WD40 repeat domain-containing protein n=1 Tax=Streptomyces sp. NPDC048483 TaxID=3154927 RepID=UPI0034395E6C